MRQRRRAAFTLIELPFDIPRPARDRELRTATPPVVSGREARGFTLVELLVVIAILALLLSLLMPFLRRARELAYTALCASNERCHGAAVHQFVTTYNGYLPPNQRAR